MGWAIHPVGTLSAIGALFRFSPGQNEEAILVPSPPPYFGSNALRKDQEKRMDVGFLSGRNGRRANDSDGP